MEEDDFTEEQRPAKQNATEEKIMAKFNNLKLDVLNICVKYTKLT